MYQQGGVERVLSNLSNKLVDKCKYEIEIVSVFANSRQGDISFPVDENIKTVFLGKKMSNQKGIFNQIKAIYSYLKTLQKYLEENECDIAITTNSILSSAIEIKKDKLNCK